MNDLSTRYGIPPESIADDGAHLLLGGHRFDIHVNDLGETSLLFGGYPVERDDLLPIVMDSASPDGNAFWLRRQRTFSVQVAVFLVCVAAMLVSLAAAGLVETGLGQTVFGVVALVALVAAGHATRTALRCHRVLDRKGTQ